LNTEITVHPKLHHFGLATSNLNAMVDWYHKVLGMSVNHREALPPGVRHAPFFRLCIRQQR
jgi:catechol 2,3-dioxygenase-like lactoylglutathione lyase family enzyme